MHAMFSRLLLLSTVVALCVGEPEWNSLRTTWGINLFSSRIFAKMPRTKSDAESKGFTEVPGPCSGGKFLGQRYTPSDEVAVVLIYDVNGYIAGIQQGLLKSEVEKLNTSYTITKMPQYQLDTIRGQDVYLLTAYFVDPETICSTGRSESEFQQQGTGTNLYFQNGTDPVGQSFKVPMYESQQEGTIWTKGQCFYSMGQHYWFNAYEGMNCNQTVPFFVLYNRGKLTGFGFASFGNLDFSDRFEHPPKFTIKSFLPNPVPSCIYSKYDEAGGVTTFHVYFNVRPWNIMC